MIRHKSFKDEHQLRVFVREKIPSDAYHSAAYYSNPERDMAAKGWKGADLVFDIDADHIQTPCKMSHDIWRCKSCNSSGRGSVPGSCPKCRASTFDKEEWLCEICLERAKDELIKLIEYLEADFGIGHEELYAYFSGHRGYHVHVTADSVRPLSDSERREITDYLTAQGIEVDLEQLRLNRFNINQGGWRGRILQGVYEYILKTRREELLEMGLSEASADILLAWVDKPESALGTVVRKLTRREAEVFSQLVDRAVALKAIPIDTVVTTDVHRLIRLDGSLHSKTGFAVTQVPISGIDSFDPFSYAPVLTGEDEVYVKVAPQFRIGQKTFGPYEGQKVILPTNAAVLLVAKGRAEPSGQINL